MCDVTIKCAALRLGYVVVTALNEALSAEVQRLKLATAELNGDPSKYQQLAMSSQMFQLHQQQAAQAQLNIHQLQQQQQQSQSQQQQQSGSTPAKHETSQ